MSLDLIEIQSTERKAISYGDMHDKGSATGQWKNDGLFNIALEQLATSLRETNKGLLSHIQK